MNRRAVVLSLSLLAGCGSPAGNGMDAGVDSGTPLPSMLTTSGALTGMISAAKPTVGYDAQMDQSSFSLTRSVRVGLAFGADVNIGFTGAPAAMTYTSTSPGFTCNVTVTSGATTADTWTALFNSTAGANRGTCSLTLSSAMTSATGYDVAGTLSITADNASGAATGMVTLTGTF